MPKLLEIMLADEKFLAFAGLELLSLCFIAHLWIRRSGGTFGHKMVFSAVLLIPLLGPLYYLTLYSPPGPNRGADRASESRDAWHL